MFQQFGNFGFDCVLYVDRDTLALLLNYLHIFLVLDFVLEVVYRGISVKQFGELTCYSFLDSRLLIISWFSVVVICAFRLSGHLRGSRSATRCSFLLFIGFRSVECVVG